MIESCPQHIISHETSYFVGLRLNRPPANSTQVHSIIPALWNSLMTMWCGGCTWTAPTTPPYLIYWMKHVPFLHYDRSWNNGMCCMICYVFILQINYHGYLWPVDASKHGISLHCTDVAPLEYYVLVVNIISKYGLWARACARSCTCCESTHKNNAMILWNTIVMVTVSSCIENSGNEYYQSICNINIASEKHISQWPLLLLSLQGIKRTYLCYQLPI